MTIAPRVTIDWLPSILTAIRPSGVRSMRRCRKVLSEGGCVLAEPDLPCSWKTAKVLAIWLKAQQVVGDKPGAACTEQCGEGGLSHARTARKCERRVPHLYGAGVQDTLAG